MDILKTVVGYVFEVLGRVFSLVVMLLSAIPSDDDTDGKHASDSDARNPAIDWRGRMPDDPDYRSDKW